MRGIERQLHVLGGRPGHLAEGLAVHRAHIGHVLALDRSDPGSPYEVAVTRLDLDHAARLSRRHKWGRTALHRHGFVLFGHGSLHSLCSVARILRIGMIRPPDPPACRLTPQWPPYGLG